MTDYELEMHLGLVGSCPTCIGKMTVNGACCPACGGTGVRLTEKGCGVLARLMFVIALPCGTCDCDRSELTDDAREAGRCLAACSRCEYEHEETNDD